MKNKLPWVRLHVFDLAQDERFVLMPKAVKGVFMDALLAEWMNNGLPNDQAAVAALTHSTAREIETAWPHIVAFLEVRADGRLVYPEFEVERQRAERVSSVKSQNAKKRWEPKVVT